MKKSKSFNPEIWSNILQYENAKKLKSETISQKDLMESFSLNERQARVYHTMLLYKDQLTGSIDADIALKKLKRENEENKGKVTNLTNQIQELYDALSLTFETKVDPTKVLPINPEIYKIEQSSDIGFFSIFSDAHVEETVRKESTFGHNEYNLEIAQRRILTYFCELNEKATSQHYTNMKTSEVVRKPQLCIHLAGDNITGWIHPEGVETNSLSPAEAIVFAEHNILSGLCMLAEENNFSSITVVCTVGNHGRITEKKRYATGYRDSFEHVMYKHIKQHIERNYPQIKVIIAEGEFQVVEFMGKKICCSHGDHFRYAGGIGGLLVPAVRWVHKMSMVIPGVDLFSIGHWHSYMALPDSKLLINGSVIGSSAFSIGLAFKPEPPKMQLQYVDSKRGFTVNDPIFLT